MRYVPENVCREYSDLTGDGGDYCRCNDMAPAVQKVYCEICSGGRPLLGVVAAKCRDGQVGFSCSLSANSSVTYVL